MNQVHCNSCGDVELSKAEYTKQLSNPDNFWLCPICGSVANFVDGFVLEGTEETDDEIPF